MAISTKRAYQLAADGQLPVEEVLKTLYESEGVQGCPLVPTLGHPLQHIAVLLYPLSSRKDKASRPARAMLAGARVQGGMTPLEEWYWKRGPGNAGIKYHSMFRTDEQAGTMIHRALCGEGGVRALKYLSISGEITIALATYLDAFDLTLRREGSQQGPHLFTMRPETTTLLVTVLHARFGTLHIHTAFPALIRRRNDTLSLNPQIGWELEVTDHVTGEQRLIRTNLPAGAAC
jgi:hypothetical protein